MATTDQPEFQLDPDEIKRFSKPHMSRVQIQNLIQMRPKNLTYYRQAFVHKSILCILRHIPQGNVPEYMNVSNERMEFLGDSILSGIAAMYLYKRFQDKDEGFLTKIRSKLVDTKALSTYARKLNMGQFLLMSKHLNQIGGNNKDKLLENAMEALIGALYLDLGLEHATAFVHRLFDDYTDWEEILIDKNFKDQLLRYSQAKSFELPRYEIIGTNGPPHDRTFTVELFLNGNSAGVGCGKRKQDAEQAAAKLAINAIKGRGSPTLLGLGGC